MPQLGESVTEGTIGRWLKRPGETVAKYEPLLEVITDKVDTEVPAPEAGTVLEILVAEGETVRVGTVIARIAAAGEATGVAQPPLEQPAPVTPPALAEAQPAAAPLPAVARPADGAARSGFISPVVARLAAEHGLDLTRISGTGQGGRVTRQDVLRYLETRQVEAPVPSPAAPTAPSPP
ncbi:MAG: E3 binding domain-containing protein, partial [Chloroflexaceae bacterium]|nr:E3 binding domain-containing protein [Chloroflexaceae bacterium]